MPCSTGSCFTSSGGPRSCWPGRTGTDVARRVVDAVSADQKHVIIDACYSGLLASTRGPGGERRPLHGFSGLPGLASDDRVGFFKIGFRSSAAEIGGGIGAAALVTAAVLGLWPAAQHRSTVVGASRLDEGTTLLTLRGAF